MRCLLTWSANEQNMWVSIDLVGDKFVEGLGQTFYTSRLLIEILGNGFQCVNF